VYIWQANSGKIITSYRGHMRFVRSVSWSPDGRFIASGGEYGDNTVQIWEAFTGQHLYTHSTQYRIFAAPWSPQDAYIASASFDGSVQVWDARDGKICTTYLGHTGPVYTTAWSPDGAILISADHHGTMHLWSAQSGQLLRVFMGHTRAIKTAAFSPTGQHIASGGDDMTIYIWSAQTGKIISSYKQHTTWIRALTWSPDGNSLVSASDKTARVWSYTTADS
jgi:WD40 repeat protein